MRHALVLVANASHARLLEVRAGKVVNRLEFMNPEARQRELDLVSDKPGRQFIASGRRGSLRTGYGNDTQHDREKDTFAIELAREIDTHVHNTPLDVAIIAPPELLGLLRRALGTEATRHVKWSITHDLTALRDAEVLDAVSKVETHA